MMDEQRVEEAKEAIRRAVADAGMSAPDPELEQAIHNLFAALGSKARKIKLE